MRTTSGRLAEPQSSIAWRNSSGELIFSGHSRGAACELAPSCVWRLMQLNHRTLACLTVALAASWVNVSASGSAGHQKPARSDAPVKFSAPAPGEVIGFTPGEDRKLASWAQM